MDHHDHRAGRHFHCWLQSVTRGQRVHQEHQPVYSRWTIDHGLYVEVGGFRVFGGCSGQECHVVRRSYQLSWLLGRQALALLEELDDKSDTAWIAQAIACGQSLGFLMDAMARISSGMPLATQEIEAFPPIATTWWTYFFWWQQPVNLLLPTKAHGLKIEEVTLMQLAEKTCHPEQAPAWWRPVPRRDP